MHPIMGPSVLFDACVFVCIFRECWCRDLQQGLALSCVGSQSVGRVLLLCGFRGNKVGSIDPIEQGGGMQLFIGLF